MHTFGSATHQPFTSRMRGATQVTKTKKEDAVVAMNLRRQSERRNNERRKANVSASLERRQGERREKVNRRRQIDPTTCERDYSDAELEFMQALDDYKRKNGRMFPTCSEILEVIISLGYEKRPSPIREAMALTAAT